MEAKQLPYIFFSRQWTWWVLPQPMVKSGAGTRHIFHCVTRCLELAEKGTIRWSHLPCKAFLNHHNCFIYSFLKCKFAGQPSPRAMPADQLVPTDFSRHRTDSDAREWREGLRNSLLARVLWHVGGNGGLGGLGISAGCCCAVWAVEGPSSVGCGTAGLRNVLGQALHRERGRRESQKQS